MNKWWKDPRLDDEGTYDYLVEELPQDTSLWSRYPVNCDDCGKERRLHVTHSHYFYCWDGWDCMDYTVCWQCYLKSAIRNSISKIKKRIHNHTKKFNIGAYVIFCKFCKRNNIAKEHRSHLWESYYDYWSDKATYKFLKGMNKA